MPARLTVAVLSLLLLSALPSWTGAALAESPDPTPVPTAPCSPSEQYATLGLGGKHEDVASPQVAEDADFPRSLLPVHPGGVDSRVSYKYRLDISGSQTNPFATEANVDVKLTWDNDGDFDVNVYDAENKLLGGSNDALQDRVETVTIKGVAQCTDLRVEVVNALAPPATTMTLDTTVVLGSAAADSEIDIHDVSDDANGLWNDTPTNPISYAPADLVSVDFQTSHVTVPVGQNGTDYQPKEFRVVFQTAASPGDVAAGSQTVYEATFYDLPGKVYIEGVVSKSSAGEISTNVRLRSTSSDCTQSPDACWSESKSEWTAQISASEKTLTLSYPFSSLVATRERRAIGVGAILSFPEAATRVTGVEGAGQDGFGVGGIDEAPKGHPYVVGAEVPEDIDCTEACERVPLPCVQHAGWGDDGDAVRFFAGGDEACKSSAKLGGVRLTLTGLRCPKDSACVETTVVKVCPGRRCVADLSVPSTRAETASYRTIAKWEFGDGRTTTWTVSGLCHRLSPLDDCPDPDSGYKELVRH